MRIVSANKAFYKIFHVTEEDSVGVSLYKLGNNQWNIPRLRQLLEEIVPKNNRFQDFEVEHTFPVIGHKTMLLNAHRMVQQKRNEELIVLTILDITEVKRLAIELQVKEKNSLALQLKTEKKTFKKIEESEKRYNMMLMQSPFAFAIFKGKNLEIILANESIKEIWGKGENIEGKKLLDVLPELKNGEFPKLIDNVYKTGIPFHGYEVLFPLTRNGILENAYFNFVYQPYLEVDETISGVTVISYEVTAHVIAKNELIQAKCIAEQKTQIAEDAVKAKQQFLSNMSHEIRTPMNAIVGFTNVVLKTTLTEIQTEYVNAIKVSGDALIILINDILDLAKVDSGKMTFEQTEFNLSLSIKAMLQLFETKIKEKNLQLIFEYDDTIPQILIGDPLRLRQIILNLVSNAVKFTNEGQLTIRVNTLKEDAQKIKIKFIIEDTGIGIPDNRLGQIFNSFEQAARETSRSYGGSGLGLAIVKQLVELQDGTLIIQSTEGKGSTFGFVLTFEKTNPKKNSLKKSEDVLVLKEIKTNSKALKILVVEDIALNQLLMKIVLSDFGFTFDIADNGKIAIDLLQKNNYDIILMDLQMPEMNGFEATSHIRNVLNSQIPIIALTADVTTVDLDKCTNVGMNDYISKPIDEKLLFAKINKCLKINI
jgi:two-component system CheB/CheR fusion protein